MTQSIVHMKTNDIFGSRRSGFTLIELTISMAILTVVSMLTLLVARSTTSAVAVAGAKEQAQASLRNAMGAMTAELQLASKSSNSSLTPQLAALAVSTDGKKVTFQVPADDTGATWSSTIQYQFVTEDGGTGATAGNAQLDAGEDANGDGVLTRRIVRTQDGVSTVVGAANDVSFAQFAVNPAGDVVTISLVASKAVNNRRRDVIQVTTTSSVYLQN